MEKLVCITGTNASGKSSLAIELAPKFDAEIVSADSRQVFKGLDLGSGKVTREEMKGVRHHLIDVAEPGEFFSLAHFQHLAYEAIDDIHQRGRRAFLTGGTGLYINAVADGYDLSGAAPDPALRRSVEEKTKEELIDIIKSKSEDALYGLDLNNKRRLERAAEKALSNDIKRPNKPRYETLILGVTWPRDELYERIRIRLDARLEEGMIDEVKNLMSCGVSDDFLYRLGLEYRYILMYLRGRFSDYDSFYKKLFMEIRHLAKEQMTWFRKRSDIVWIDMKDDPAGKCSDIIDAFYKR
ncbi:MAG: tRNA (adenosine(37)-N6)-dimethylallyltransferase MiaA [Lachnospiraceae bacterium]|nr:tRNA (adenosine(37)-N6)-dimethylallyltransferase MiaA [Lachnospiraceae bacterium]